MAALRTLMDSDGALPRPRSTGTTHPQHRFLCLVPGPSHGPRLADGGGGRTPVPEQVFFMRPHACMRVHACALHSVCPLPCKGYWCPCVSTGVWTQSTCVHRYALCASVDGYWCSGVTPRPGMEGSVGMGELISTCVSVNAHIGACTVLCGPVGVMWTLVAH